MLNRSSEFSMPGCCFCHNVLRIIVSHNPGHQKAFFLNVEMNTMKFILVMVAGTKSSLKSGITEKFLEWSFNMDGAVHCCSVSGGHDCCAPFRDLRKLDSCQMLGFFLSMPCISDVSLPSSIFSSPFLQLEATVLSGLLA